MPNEEDYLFSLRGWVNVNSMPVKSAGMAVVWSQTLDILAPYIGCFHQNISLVIQGTLVSPFKIKTSLQRWTVKSLARAVFSVVRKQPAYNKIPVLNSYPSSSPCCKRKVLAQLLGLTASCNMPCQNTVAQQRQCNLQIYTGCGSEPFLHLFFCSF